MNQVLFAAAAPLYSIGAAASSVISRLFGARPEVTKFADFSSVDSLFIQEAHVPAAERGEVLVSSLQPLIASNLLVAQL